MTGPRWRPPRAALAAGGALALGAATVAYARNVHWDSALAVIRHASVPLLALALALHLGGLGAKSGVWWLCLRPIGGPGIVTVARTMFGGAALNALFVANSGEASRVIVMSRATGLPSSAVLATVALERMVDVLGFAVMLGASVAALPLPVPRSGALLASAVALVVTVIVVSRSRAPTSRGGPAAVRVAGAVRRRAERLLLTARRVVTPARLGIALLLTLIGWSCELASYHLVARAAGLPVGLADSLWALLAVNAGLVARVSPGNVGVFELAYASAARARGAPVDAAVAVGLLIHLLQDVPTIVLGLAVGHRLLARSADSRPRVAPPAGIGITSNPESLP